MITINNHLAFNQHYVPRACACFSYIYKLTTGVFSKIQDFNVGSWISCFKSIH